MSSMEVFDCYKNLILFGVDYKECVYLNRTQIKIKLNIVFSSIFYVNILAHKKSYSGVNLSRF